MYVVDIYRKVYKCKNCSDDEHTNIFKAAAPVSVMKGSMAMSRLLEETGYTSDEQRFLLTVPSNATIADNYAYLFEAKNCRQVSQQELDDTEFLNVIKLPENEIERMITEGEFQQAMHIAAWLMTKRE